MAEKVKWNKIGDHEHSLLPGKHLIFGNVYHTDTMTEKDLISLLQKGSNQVRKSAKKPTTKIEETK